MTNVFNYGTVKIASGTEQTRNERSVYIFLEKPRNAHLCRYSAVHFYLLQRLVSVVL